MCFLAAGGPASKGPFEVETKIMLNGHSAPMEGQQWVGGINQKHSRAWNLDHMRLFSMVTNSSLLTNSSWIIKYFYGSVSERAAVKLKHMEPAR